MGLDVLCVVKASEQWGKIKHKTASRANSVTPKLSCNKQMVKRLCKAEPVCTFLWTLGLCRISRNSMWTSILWHLPWALEGNEMVTIHSEQKPREQGCSWLPASSCWVWLGPFNDIFMMLLQLNQWVLRFVGFVTRYSLKENCNENKSGAPEEMWDSTWRAEVR